ncbi:ABC transporter substrate-binding protein [Falsiroseomonas stagni]|uniref:ABC-type nitrate/sulfonate/bicarbonate transport system, substrate-binding protein n=1 Tax=Falsiroseomonas stagni DSM 19981 TaxID=1123062 RepID=A0A1I4DCA3_9PROT|nr:ABC transporter substrate-binding protein [Falsiroseomonas stagni]SFK89987.1 ABC-type nitrate/sulfonate/bicarbonate transport system, substrate-binding protein [Falsiroseomonas stagni DSM 19981]
MINRRSLLAAGTAAALPIPAFAQGAPIRMTIATGVDPSFAPYYVAREGGFFQRNGLDVTVNTGPSGSAMIAFLVGNQINSAYGAEQAGVSAHLVDPNVVAVAEGTALLRWISILGRNVENMEALKGKRVGVARGTGSETFWLSVVAKLNLNPADYTIVNVEAPEMVAALERGNIDAFAVWEPWPTRAMRAIPNTKILLSNDQIQIVRNFIYMNKGWAESNQEATQRFMRSMIQAQEFIASNPTEAAAQVARFLRQDRAFIAELMTKVEFKVNLTPDSVGNIQLAIDQLRGMNRLARPVTPDQVIWKAPLAAAAAGRVTI